MDDTNRGLQFLGSPALMEATRTLIHFWEDYGERMVRDYRKNFIFYTLRPLVLECYTRGLSPDIPTKLNELLLEVA